MPSDDVREGSAPTADPDSRRLDVQGLRAVAVLLVVAFHAGLPVSGGFTGVDVFLVISGFVITGMLMRELHSTGTIRFRNFYSRRIKRLLPALALVTTLVMALSFFFGSPFGSQQTTAKTGLGATYFSANVVIYRDSTEYFAPAAANNPLLNTWTLSVEEQVYLVFPALLLGSWFVGRRLLHASKRGAAVMLTTIGGLSFALSLLTSYGILRTFASPESFAFFSSTTRLWEFAIGALIALAAPTLKRIPQSASLVLGVGGACFIAVGAFTISDLTPYPGFAVLLPVLGAAAIITAGFRTSTGIPRLLAVKPMTKIGDLSYSWYLWHWPLIVFGTVVWPTSSLIKVALAGVSLIPAWLSKAHVEDPLRRSTTINGRRVAVLAAVCTIIPTLAAVGLWVGADASWGSSAAAQMEAQVRARHAAARGNCDDFVLNGSSMGEPKCEFNPLAKGPHVYLVGNSVAAQYSEALIGATKQIGSPLTIDTNTNCSFGARASVADQVCVDTLPETVDTLVLQEPGVVVMSSTWDLKTPAGAISGLTEAVSALREAGHEVVIVLPTPHFFLGGTPGTFFASPSSSTSGKEAHATAWSPSDCWNLVALRDPEGCGATVPEAQVEASQADTYEWLKEVAASTSSMTLDLRSAFCSEALCRTNIGNEWMFRDGIHITVDESEKLAPEFVDALTAILYEEAKPNVPSSPSPTRSARP